MGKKRVKLIVLIFLAAGFSLSLLSCAAPPAMPEKPEVVQRIEPSGIFSNPQITAADYPSPDNVIAATQNNEELINLIYEECDVLLNADEDKGETLEQVIAAGSLTKHPAADANFGKIENTVSRVKKEIVIEGAQNGYIFTGLYAAAGEIVTVTVPENKINSFSVIIAPSLGNINKADDISQQRDLIRIPKVKREFSVLQGTTKFGTPYGGLIVLYKKGASFSDGAGQDNFSVIISGAVQTPSYVLGKTTDEEWEEAKEFKGLTAHFVTANMNIIFPLKDRAVLEQNPKTALSYWQSVLSFQDSITFDKALRVKKITMFFDSYLAASGAWAYATVPNDVCNFNADYIAKFLDYENTIENGAWGVFHELGHHHQNLLSKGSTDMPWTFSGDEEVTVNILSLLSTISYTARQYTRFDKPLSGNERFADYYTAISVAQTIDPLVTSYSQFTYEQKLSMYGILICRFGVQSFRELLSGYEQITAENDYLLQQEKHDEFLIRASKAFSYDLRDFFDYFKLNNSFAAKEKVANMKLPVFYPVASKYGGEKIVLSDNGEIEIDFNESLNHLYGEVKLKSASVKNKQNLWTKTGKFKYSFTPVEITKKFKEKVALKIKTPSELIELDVKIILQSGDNVVTDYFSFEEFGVYNGNTKAVQSGYETVGKTFVKVVPVTLYIVIIISIVLGAAAGVLAIIFLRKKEQ